MVDGFPCARKLLVLVAWRFIAMGAGMVEGIDMVEAPSSVSGSLSSSDLFPIGSSDGGSVNGEKSTDAS